MGKWLGRLSYLDLIRQPVLEKENSEFTTVVFRLKIDLVSYPSCGREVVFCVLRPIDKYMGFEAK